MVFHLFEPAPEQPVEMGGDPEPGAADIKDLIQDGPLGSGMISLEPGVKADSATGALISASSQRTCVQTLHTFLHT